VTEAFIHTCRSLNSYLSSIHHYISPFTCMAATPLAHSQVRLFFVVAARTTQSQFKPIKRIIMLIILRSAIVLLNKHVYKMLQHYKNK